MKFDFKETCENAKLIGETIIALFLAYDQFFKHFGKFLARQLAKAVRIYSSLKKTLSNYSVSFGIVLYAILSLSFLKKSPIVPSATILTIKGLLKKSSVLAYKMLTDGMPFFKRLLTLKILPSALFEKTGSENFILSAILDSLFKKIFYWDELMGVLGELSLSIKKISFYPGEFALLKKLKLLDI